MNCKHCNAELGENSKFCSNCGKPVETEEQVTTINDIPVQEPVRGPEIEEPKKSGAGKIALAVVAVVLVLAVLIGLIAGGLTAAKSDDEDAADTTDSTDAAVEETVAATVPADTGLDDVTCKGSYSASAEDVQAAADTVVATMGDRELTVSQLQIYYWTEFVYFMQDYSYYAAYLGLDYTQPLDTQVCTMSEESMTWQQYFLSCALESWKSYQSMTLMAEENGLELTEELQTELAELEVSLDTTAVSYGLADGEELMQANFGPAATVEGYIDYWELYYTGWLHYEAECNKLMPTADEVEAYFAENETTYADSGVTKDAGKYVDVRHILIMPEGGTYDEETYTTTYSDEEWAAAETKAQEILAQWLAGDMTEDSFAALANENSADSDGTDGGLYTNVYEGQMVENFENWCFDETRQVGDYGLVQTEYGYHIMYFVDSRDIWYYTAETDLMNERADGVVTAALEKYPAEIDYEAILLGLVELS